MDKEKLSGEFDKIFGQDASPKRYFFSPGRVNLIGEHLDYNGGHVLPCALQMGNTIFTRENKKGLIRAYSVNFPEDGIILLHPDKENKLNGKWTDYLIGALELTKYTGKGLDIYLEGNLPPGAGLSSSASVSCGYIYALDSNMGKERDRKETALLAQQIEHRYIGVNCGIMDQYAIMYGEENKAVYLDTDTITHEVADLNLRGLKILIINSKVKRNLKDSSYNERRLVCEKAEFLLHKKLAKAELKEIHRLPLTGREMDMATYIREEEERIRNAFMSLKEGNMENFGRLMNESHMGMKDKFRITCEEVDFLTSYMRKKGSLGSRMTGGGFGGCTVNIVPDNMGESVILELEEEYRKKYGITPGFYYIKPSGGTGEV